MTSDAQLRANRKHLKEKLDHISFRVPKGQRAVIQAHAKSMAESVNAFITRAVNTTMELDVSMVASDSNSQELQE